MMINKQGRNISVTARLSYIYWSYEEYGRCYIGVRLCPKKFPTPGLDSKYFGSYRDKSFKPTHKIILNVFNNHEDAKDEEVELHNAFDVGRNPHFANLARSTSTKFSFSAAGENNPVHSKKLSEETRKKKSEAKIGKPSPKRNQEDWDNYHLIKDLHILNPELGSWSLCKPYNNTFGTNYPRDSFQKILSKIKRN